MRTKTCLRCRQEKPLEQFNVDRSRKDERHPYCTACKVGPYLIGNEKREARREAIRKRLTKVCSRCKTSKPLSDFYRSARSLDGRSSCCRVCGAKAAREWSSTPEAKAKQRRYYDMRKQQLSGSSKRSRDARKLEVILSMGGACADCALKPGEEWPLACFDFHHLDPRGKDTTVAKLLSNARNLQRAKDEARKCLVLCSNCHRRRHALPLPSLYTDDSARTHTVD